MDSKQAKLVLKFLKQKFAFTPNGIFLVGVRGYVPKDGSLVRLNEKVDVFDDSIAVLRSTAKGVIVNSFEATIDPGLPWVLKPMSGVVGAGRKEEGHYQYKHGLHKGIPALVQSSKVIARRDVNRDGVWHESEPIQEGFFAMNIHPKLANSKNVGVNSAGCTVVNSMPKEKEWLDFYSLTTEKSVIDYFILNQGTFDALLVT